MKFGLCNKSELTNLQDTNQIVLVDDLPAIYNNGFSITIKSIDDRLNDKASAEYNPVVNRCKTRVPAFT